MTAKPPLGETLARGIRRRCPQCGKGASFRGYLKIVDHCALCGERLGHYRADDLPAYLTILIAGHVFVPLIFSLEKNYAPPLLFSMVVYPALITLFVLWILPHVKGGVLAWMWRIYHDQGQVDC